ncbi:MAG TPA: ParB N-terminal domain-containing protein [Anaerolineae bacterium]|nr:ParB N-terminal domain-containing protein [Anaerolineae bacterium]
MPSARPEAELPPLKIVPTASLVLHEEFEAQRSAPLAARLFSDGVLKNPPIVASIEGDNRYVVLDGTNRAVAMAALAAPHILVQVVDYDDPQLILDTWSHLVTEMPHDEFFDGVKALDELRLEPSDQLHARAELARRRAVAYVILWDAAQPDMSRAAKPGAHRVYLLYVDDDRRGKTAILTRLVDTYQPRGRINRVSTDHFNQLLPLYDNVTALVVFPRYTPSEIVELARQGAYLPTGVTRHVIPGRALRLNFPLAVLIDHRQSLEGKNAWLQDWIRAKLANKEVRYYQESTYLFDE